jgi:hypothetical protein
MELAGGDGASTVFSHLVASHSHVRGVLGFLSTREASSLRLVCKELRASVTDFKWEDGCSSIRGSLGRWRACFPHARVANVSGRADLTDADFVHLRNVNVIFMMSCTGVTDAAFSHLTACRTLDMSHCNQRGISDAAFPHLVNIRTLNMSGCNQATITDAAFASLAELRSLGISQSTFGLYPRLRLTDRAFTGLRKLESLCASGLDAITDVAFDNLTELKQLNLAWCDQSELSDRCFEKLTRLEVLDIRACSQLTDGALTALKRLRVLDIRGCMKISPECVANIAARLDALFVADCSDDVKIAAKRVGGARVFL